MPWCNECDRFLSPSTVLADGTCPTCGRAIDPGRAHAPGQVSSTPPRIVDAQEIEEPPIVPWHFKLLVGAIAVYLGYRFLQIAEWLWHRVS